MDWLPYEDLQKFQPISCNNPSLKERGRSTKAPGMQNIPQASTQERYFFDLRVPLIFSLFPEHWGKECMGWNDENQSFQKDYIKNIVSSEERFSGYYSKGHKTKKWIKGKKKFVLETARISVSLNTLQNIQQDINWFTMRLQCKFYNKNTLS